MRLVVVIRICRRNAHLSPAAALGSTVEALRQHFRANTPNVAKTRFSMVLDDGSTDEFLTEKKVHSVMLVGIESHVCVLQTCLDLLSKGYAVFVIRDAVSSCNRQEVPTALEVRADNGRAMAYL